ncbi:MAG: hypothetical protein L3V56_12380 [Candidatus Magnetoovum sp. WYHC-5]|nr:hypothetical protein [Candidatus Magnetoovum sp. WYHC-5]
MNDELLKAMLSLYNNPMFKEAFSDYMFKVQRDGVEAARRFWSQQPEKDRFFTSTTDMFEKMMNFYSEMGFVSRKKYDDALKEIEELKKENAFLRDTMQKFNLKVFEDGGKSIQEAWKDTMNKQMELSKEITKSMFDLFKDISKK